MTNDEIDTLILAKQSVLTDVIAKLTTIVANPKPDYNIDGQQVSWSSYRDSLLKIQKEEIDSIIALQKMKNLFNPFLIKSVMR